MAGDKFDGRAIAPSYKHGRKRQSAAEAAPFDGVPTGAQQATALPHLTEYRLPTGTGMPPCSARSRSAVEQVPRVESDSVARYVPSRVCPAAIVDMIGSQQAIIEGEGNGVWWGHCEARRAERRAANF